MSCYHPLKAFDVSAVYGLTNNNKKNYKICSYNINHIELIKGNLYPVETSFRSSLCERYLSEYIEIPCGHCIGCRLDYSRQWADRMMLEASYHESNYFITLTYNDEHIPISYYADASTGEALPSLTLSKRDVQLFFKRLRKATGQQIRYYLCGEYGATTHRPHYHAIVFGLELNDLVEFRKKDGFTYFTSDTISKAWSVCIPGTCSSSSIGFSMVAPVTWETCAYVSRYVTKKLNGAEAEFYDTFNLLPEFSLMSRRPGIARLYYDEHKEDIYKYQSISISTSKGGLNIRPPRYYDKLFDFDYPDEMEEIKRARLEISKAKRELKLSRTNLSYLELLEVEERNKLKKVVSLDRSEI